MFPIGLNDHQREHTVNLPDNHLKMLRPCLQASLSSRPPPLQFGKRRLKCGREVTPGQVSSEGVPSIRKMHMSWPTSESPGKSARPVAISAKMHPADQMSTLLSYRPPSNTSGGRYHKVTTSFVRFPVSHPDPANGLRLNPKSAIFRLPVFKSTRMFLSFVVEARLFCTNSETLDKSKNAKS